MEAVRAGGPDFDSISLLAGIHAKQDEVFGAGDSISPCNFSDGEASVGEITTVLISEDLIDLYLLWRSRLGVILRHTSLHFILLPDRAACGPGPYLHI